MLAARPLALIAGVLLLIACGPQDTPQIADYPVVRNPPQAYADGMVSAHDCLRSELPLPWRLSSLTVDRRYPPEPGVVAGAQVFAPSRDLDLPIAEHDTANQAVVLLGVSSALLEAPPGAATTWNAYPIERLDENIRQGITRPVTDPASGRLFDAYHSAGAQRLLILKDRSGACEETKGNYLNGEFPTPVWNCDFKSADGRWYARYAASSFDATQLPRIHGLVSAAASTVIACLESAEKR